MVPIQPTITADDRAAAMGWRLDDTGNRDARFGAGALATSNPQRLHEHQIWHPNLFSPLGASAAADVHKERRVGSC
jgi:hypothetical protein